MKTYFLAFLLLPLFLSSQETKPVIKRQTYLLYSDVTEYNVLKDNKKVMHGDYVKYTTYGTCIRLVESGAYNMGEKEGIWQTYYGILKLPSGKRNINCVKETGGYIKGKKNGLWKEYHPDTSSTNMSLNKIDSADINGYSFEIKQQNLPLKSKCIYENDKRIGSLETYNYQGTISQIYNFSDSTLVFDETLIDQPYNLNRYPVFIGGYGALRDSLDKNIDFKSCYSKISDSARANIQFTILPNGNIINPTILDERTFNANISFRKECIKSLLSTNNCWAPALKDGKPITSNYRIEFKAIKDASTFKILFDPKQK